MDVIADALKEQKQYSELFKLWNDWEYDMKSYLFLDLAIVHRCFDGVRLIGDILGPNVYLTPYDESAKVTPLYITRLLSKTHKDYEELVFLMDNRIENSKPWNRRKGLIFAWKKHKIGKLPFGIMKKIAVEYL